MSDVPKLLQVMKQYKIQPKNEYNMDKKGLMMGSAARCKVICRRGRRIPRLTHNRSRSCVTVIEAVSAAGVPLPPMIINQGTAHYKG